MAEEKNLRSLEGGFHSYLGDGVYASYDGFQIWLAVNDHRNKVVAIDDHVKAALINYFERLNTALVEHDRKRRHDRATDDQNKDDNSQG